MKPYYRWGIPILALLMIFSSIPLSGGSGKTPENGEDFEVEEMEDTWEIDEDEM